jgi:hypothetical protein
VQAPVLAEQVQARSYPPTAGKPGVPSLQVRIPALLDDYKKKKKERSREEVELPVCYVEITKIRFLK